MINLGIFLQLLATSLVKPDYLPKANTPQFVIIMNFLFVITGIIAVFMVVFAGIQLIISTGEPEKIATARRTILYAIVGIIFITFSSVIVNFVWGKV